MAPKLDEEKYIPGASEQKVIDANARAKAAPYTSDPAVLSARRSDQFEKAYLERTAPRNNVTTAGTEVELKDAMGRPRGFGTEGAPYVTKPAPAVVNAGDMPAGWPEKGVAPVSAPVKAVPASGKGSIMNQTFNALAGQKLDVAGPGRVGNPEHQKIFDQKYAEIAAAQGQPVRSVMSSRKTYQGKPVPKASAVVPTETPVVAPSQNSIPTPAVPEVAPAVPEGKVVANPASNILDLIGNKKNITPEKLQQARNILDSVSDAGERAAILRRFTSLGTPEEIKALTPVVTPTEQIDPAVKLDADQKKWEGNNLTAFGQPSLFSGDSPRERSAKAIAYKTQMEEMAAIGRKNQALRELVKSEKNKNVAGL